MLLLLFHFSFICIMQFVTELIALIFKDLTRKNFSPNLCSQMDECNERTIYMYRLQYCNFIVTLKQCTATSVNFNSA